MQIISKVAEKKLIRSSLKFFRIKRKNRGDGLGGCATQCQNGRSMIEMLGVLAIIGVLSVGGIMGYSKAMAKMKVNKIIEQVTFIATNIRTTFANQGNYEGVNNYNALKKAHIASEGTLKCNANTNHCSINLASDVSTTIYPSSDNKSFFIDVYVQGGGEILTEAQCMELLTHDWRNAPGIVAVGFFGYWGDPIYDADINCNGVSGNKGYACINGSVSSIPMSLDQAQLICDHSRRDAADDDGSEYAIGLKFR